MTFSTAVELAEELLTALDSVTERIVVAGSIRRHNPHPNDIELVCIPKSAPQYDLFQNVVGTDRDPGFISFVNSLEKIKGEPTGKYTQRRFRGEIVDIFMVTKENWGSQLVIRSGPADFSHNLMIAINKRGLEHRDGYLWKDDKMIPVREEKELFDILGFPYLEPWERNADSYKKVRS